MGYGDEIIALGQVQEIVRLSDIQKVEIVGSNGERRWSDLWEEHPEIAKRNERGDFQLKNGPNARPYIKSWDTWGGKARSIFSGWRVRDFRAKLKLPASAIVEGAELKTATGSYILVEPNIKGPGSPNKLWGVERFQKVVDSIRWAKPEISIVQFDNGGPMLEGVLRIVSPSFVSALGIMSSTSAYLGIEGGLHHAAGALGIPAVVVFGGFTSPEFVGYPEHRNFFIEGPESPCGRWAPCPHCEIAMSKIKPAYVAAALTDLLEEV